MSVVEITEVIHGDQAAQMPRIAVAIPDELAAHPVPSRTRVHEQEIRVRQARAFNFELILASAGSLADITPGEANVP